MIGNIILYYFEVINSSTSFILLFGLIEDHALSGEHETGDTSGVNEGCSYNFGWVNDSAFF